MHDLLTRNVGNQKHGEQAFAQINHSRSSYMGCMFIGRVVVTILSIVGFLVIYG